MVQRMSREEFWRWVEEQEDSARYERVAGEPVAMSPERIAHVRAKYRIWQVFDRQLRDQGLKCEALGDGVTVQVGEDDDYEPDVTINCGPPLADDAKIATNPVVVVEVVSPSSRSRDAGAKLGGYSSVPSVQHYLIVHTERSLVVHHRRTGPDTFQSRIVHSGEISLAPPGIVLSLDEIYLR